jgi:hypothetical protein
LKAGAGVKNKARAKFIKMIAKLPHGREEIWKAKAVV